jgi:hypothetical protein
MVVGWLLCALIWDGIMGVMVAKHYKPKKSN